VTEAHLISFARSLTSLSLGTRRAYLSVVRRFFAYLLRRGWLLASPAESVPLPTVVALPRRVPSVKDLRRLLAVVGSWRVTAERDRAILEVLYGSGLRRGECCRLDLGDVDLGEATLWVRDGKGRKDRVVPLSGRAVVALADYLRMNRPGLVQDPWERALFLSERGGRLCPSALARMVSKAARHAGLDLSPHSLRHACATHLLKGGADVRLIQKLLGHKKLGTTSLYTQVTVLDLRDAVARAHPRERRRRKR
jgi:site-specific recombinase XerD